MKNFNSEMTGEQLLTDFKVVVTDVEALIRETANHGDEHLAEIRAKVEESLKTAKDRMAETQAGLFLKTEQAAKATDTYVHEHPWQSLSIAASVGLVIGFLLCRR